MAKKVVAHALFDFVDPDGVRRVALHGETIHVAGAELARGEEHGAFFADGQEPVSAARPLDGALVGDDEVLDGEVDDVDLVAAVAGMDAETRAALTAALAAVDAGSVSSPVGAQSSPIYDELSSTGSVEGDAEASEERPARTANKAVWLEFRGLGDLTEEQASAVTLKELQDDEFMASYQRPIA